jgi:hypothetical protein
MSTQPFASGGGGVMAGASSDQSTHAVADDHQFTGLHRPDLQQGIEQIRECAPVDGDMKTAVVVEIDRRVAEVSRQCGAVVVSLPVPLQIVQA